jgi:hypothetical protein
LNYSKYDIVWTKNFITAQYKAMLPQIHALITLIKETEKKVNNKHKERMDFSKELVKIGN